MTQTADVSTFQGLIFALQNYWAEQGCVILQPYDMEMGAGTFHTATFLRSIGPEPWNAAYVQPSRRPTDGRYGENPNRLQHYYQFQVAMKPSPKNIQDLYLGSLEMMGIGEITYGIERIAMYLQHVESLFDLVWTIGPQGPVTYGDVFHQNEVEQSAYNFEHADVDFLFQLFDQCEKDSTKLIETGLPLPAYEQVLKASHAFNLLDARHAISVTERQRYILRVRALARAVAQAYYEARERLGFPMAREAVAGEAAHG